MIRLRMPSPYPEQAAAMADEAALTVIEAAPVTQMVSATMAWLFAMSMKSTVTGRAAYVFACSQPTKHRARLHEWIETARQPGDEVLRATSFGALVLDRVRLYVCRSDELDELPVESFRSMALVDAHEAPDPRPWIAQHWCGPRPQIGEVGRAGHVRLVGEVGSPGQWFRELARRAEAGTERGASYHRVTAEHALVAGRVTQESLLAIRQTMPAPTYARRFLCSTAQVRDDGATLRINTFCRRRLKIRDKSGKIIPFRFNSTQTRLTAWLQLRRRELRAKGLPLLFMVLKFRRGGVTTYAQGESYKLTSTTPDTQALTLAHTQKATSQIFRIAKLFHQKDELAPRLRGVGNAQRLEFEDLNSQFFIGTAGSPGESRGDTLQRVHCSEVAFWRTPGGEEAKRNLIGGLTEAASHGEVILESTPNGMDYFAQLYKEGKSGQNLWNVIFMPWWWDATLRMPPGTFSDQEILDTLSDREKHLMQEHGLFLSQVAWRRMKVKALGALFPQEYPEDDVSCFLLSGLIYFTPSTILDLAESTPEYETEPIGGYGYSVIWEEPIEGEDYVIGCDTSEGIPGPNADGSGGSDPNGFGVLHKRSGRQVAAVHGIFRPDELAHLAVRWAIKYNRALLGVERNNHGHAVLLEIEHLGYTQPNDELYYADDGRAGWVTSVVTRPIMLSDLRLMLDSEGSEQMIRDRQLLSECMLFKKQQTGKYEGKPDDCVMKWAIAWQMRGVERPKHDIGSVRYG